MNNQFLKSMMKKKYFAKGRSSAALLKNLFLLQILLADTFKQIINYPIGNKVVKELTKVKFCINSPVFAKSRSFN